MILLQITAYLSRPIAVSDDYSPTIDGIIEYSVREELGLLDTNPLPETYRPCPIPIKQHELGWNCASSPHYIVEKESTTQYVKRVDWKPEHLNKQPKKVSGSEGLMKNYQLPLFLRNTPRIDWFVVGDRQEIECALSRVTHVGKKRSQGFGLVTEWQVKEIDQDYSLYGSNGQLMRPVPANITIPSELFKNPKLCPNVMFWAWKNPTWWYQNQAACWMPKGNVVTVSNSKKTLV